MVSSLPQSIPAVTCPVSTGACVWGMAWINTSATALAPATSGRTAPCVSPADPLEISSHILLRLCFHLGISNILLSNRERERDPIWSHLFSEPSAEFVSLIHTNKELLWCYLMWFDVCGWLSHRYLITPEQLTFVCDSEMEREQGEVDRL